FDFYWPAEPESFRHGWGILTLDSDDSNRFLEILQGERSTTNQPTATDRNDDSINLRIVFDNFQSNGALSSHHHWISVWVDKYHISTFTKAYGFFIGFVVASSNLSQFSSTFFYRVFLVWVSGLRHVYYRTSSKETADVGNRIAVIPRRCSNNRFSGRTIFDRIGCASYLEDANWLEVFEFEIHARADVT